jgi:hypothetical protein
MQRQVSSKSLAYHHGPCTRRGKASDMYHSLPSRWGSQRASWSWKEPRALIFINTWLLDILRSPVSEDYQYRSTLDEQTLNMSQKGLRDFVLEWWSLGDAAGVECSQ